MPCPVLIASLWLWACPHAAAADHAPATAARTVHFKTPDGWTLAARYRAPRLGRPVVILVHGVAAGKDEWAPLEAELERRGVGSLAVDLRGHGESLRGPAGDTDFRGFDAAGEWPKAAKDIAAATAFLQRQGIAPSRVGYLGASIGANLVSRAQPRPRWLALLSPGIDYRGVRLARAPDGLPVMVAASPSDAYALRTAADYASLRPATVFLRARQGHGAQMLSDREFMDRLLDWIERGGR
ncbi:MAG TPA: hypothetical protein DEB40_11225 [Elusimicrobia bacterium]|nr:hypothetical protein [Elusimicrobiota bacterium]HBT62303.1 hypothetical protein [Elusimicrobiota bacterium]